MEAIYEHLAAAIAAGVAAFVLWLRSMLMDLYRRHLLETALDRAAGLALANPAVRAGVEAAIEDATRIGADYLRRTIPDTLRALGVGGVLVDMVRGEIGLHLEQIARPEPEPVRIPRTPVLFEGEE